MCDGRFLESAYDGACARADEHEERANTVEDVLSMIVRRGSFSPDAQELSVRMTPGEWARVKRIAGGSRW
jgi:hypothetical protein